MTTKSQKSTPVDYDNNAQFDFFLSLFEAAGLAVIVFKKNQIIKYTPGADAFFYTSMQVPQMKSSFLHLLPLQPIGKDFLFQSNKNNLQPLKFLYDFKSDDGSIHKREVILNQIVWSEESYTVVILKEIHQDINQSHISEKDDTQRSKMAKRIEQLNSALKSLIENREIEKQSIEAYVWNSFKTIVYPYLEKMANCPYSKTCRTNYRTIERNIALIGAPEGGPDLQFLHKLTPCEIKIVDLVRQGKSNKEISQVLNLALRSICWYRNRIRKKLGLVGAKINLREYLVQNYTNHTRPI
jgi:hypothetical protein